MFIWHNIVGFTGIDHPYEPPLNSTEVCQSLEEIHDAESRFLNAFRT